MTPTVVLSPVAQCLSEFGLKSISRADVHQYLVSSKFGDCVIKGVTVKLKGWSGEYIADKVTGTLYRVGNGACLSSDQRRLVGLYEGQQLKPAVSALKTTLSKPLRVRKTDAVRGEKGRVCGSSKHSAIITEEIVMEIRQHKPGTDSIFVLTSQQAAEKYGITTKTVSDIRRRRTWRHVP